MDTLVQLSGFGDTLLGYLLPFLFVLTVVVFVHELGHFLVARWCGVAIKTFSIGFGPEIFGFNDRHGTRWRLSWIPLGGYVKFIDDENAASAGQKSLEQLTPQERAHSFQGKSLGQRAAIVAAGPIANFLLAVVIFTMIFGLFGERITAAKVDIVTPGSAAARAGFVPGDKVVSIDGQVIESFSEMQRIVGTSPDQPLHFIVERDGKTVDITATPERKEITDNFGNVIRLGLLNLFPIPMLDGGHLLFYSIEAIRGRPLSESTQEIGFRIGLAFVLMLMIFATWNDLIHLKFL